MADFDLADLTSNQLRGAIFGAKHLQARCEEYGYPAAAVFADLRAMLGADEAWRAARQGVKPAWHVNRLQDLDPKIAATERNRACVYAATLRDHIGGGGAEARLWNAVAASMREPDSDRIAAEATLARWGA